MRPALLVAVLFAVLVAAKIRENVQFSPIDPHLTDPATLWYGMKNMLPQEYNDDPHWPISQSKGSIAMDIVAQAYPNETTRCTNCWQKNLWGEEWNTTGQVVGWNPIYPYPYYVSPKEGSVSLAYLGIPGDTPATANRDIVWGLIPFNGTDSNHTGAENPFLTGGTAFDFGVEFSGTPEIASIGPLHATINFTRSGSPVATLYIVKGAPFITFEFWSATSISFGTPYEPTPVIQLNNMPPGNSASGTWFTIEIAMGPTHAMGAIWHLYFDSPVTLTLSGSSMLSVASPYTGVMQLACGELNDIMGPWLQKYAGVFPTMPTVDFDIDDETNQGVVSYNWNPRVAPNAPSSELAMLAIWHHTFVFQAQQGQAAPTNTSYWCIKGPMYSIIGDSWDLVYNLTTVGFGDTYNVDPTMKDDVSTQFLFDYKLVINQCPGDNITGQGLPGWQELELYSYVRDVASYVDLAIVGKNLGFTAEAQNLTQKVVFCLQPLFEMQTAEPQPCPPAINNTLVCVRNMLSLWYDNHWGGVVTQWYDRFAPYYWQGGQNENGWDPLANYGNSFYNDHHFQYGYIVKSMAWVLYEAANGVDVNLTTSQQAEFTKYAYGFARDYANPTSEADPYFTTARYKDFYDGHSWAEGYDYSGRVLLWINQESGGEAINSYYAVYLLGYALNDQNIIDWGRLLMAMEVVSIQKYQMLSHEQTPEQPFVGLTKWTRCLSILMGNGASSETYAGPQSLFQCGIVTFPFTPVTRSLVDPVWAGEAFEWLEWHIKAGGLCRYPWPVDQGGNDTVNPCPGPEPDNWFGNEFECCPQLDPTRPEPTQLWPNNLWKAFPDWFPILYLIQSVNDTQSAWENLAMPDLYKPNLPSLPFPYMNSYDMLVGWPPFMLRASGLYWVATHGPQQPAPPTPSTNAPVLNMRIV